MTDPKPVVLRPFSYLINFEKLPLLFGLLENNPDIFSQAKTVYDELQTSQNKLQILNRRKDFFDIIAPFSGKYSTDLEESVKIFLRYRYMVKEISGSLKYNILKDNSSTEMVYKEYGEICSLFSGIIQPSAIYAIEEAESGDGKVNLKKSGIFLTSKRLESYYFSDPPSEDVISPFIVYLVTIGSDLDDTVRRLSESGDVFKAYLLNGLGAGAAESVAQDLNDYLNNLFFPDGMGKMRRFSPGYSDWKLEEQKKLFAILQPEENIGVRLTESCMMVPEKSTSGVMAERI